MDTAVPQRRLSRTIPEKQSLFLQQMGGELLRPAYSGRYTKPAQYQRYREYRAAVFPFVSPKEKSVEKIVADFKKTQKYSPDFIKGLKEGLYSSRYFKKIK